MTFEARRDAAPTPWQAGDLPPSAYALFERAAQRFGDAPALSYIADAADFRRAHTWTFRQWLAKITQAANLFHAVGIRPNEVVACALPNLPKARFALWGAEAAGVARPIDPALAPDRVADTLREARARVLVTTTASADSGFLAALIPHLSACETLTHVFTVGAGARNSIRGVPVMKLGNRRACSPATHW